MRNRILLTIVSDVPTLELKSLIHVTESRPTMNYTEFNSLYDTSVNAMKNYFNEVEKTSAMLKVCTSEPLPYKTRLRLMLQHVAEEDARGIHLAIKSQLMDVARLGYGFVD